MTEVRRQEVHKRLGQLEHSGDYVLHSHALCDGAGRGVDGFLVWPHADYGSAPPGPTHPEPLCIWIVRRCPLKMRVSHPWRATSDLVRESVAGRVRFVRRTEMGRNRGEKVSLTGWVMRKRRAAKEHVPVLGRLSTAQYLLGQQTGLPVATRWKGSPHPIWLRPGTSDIPLFRTVLLRGEYDLPFLMNRPAAIIDAGANIGLASIWFASKFPDARIIAVEPERSNYDLLARNVAPFPNITPVHAAVWSHVGTLAVNEPNGWDPIAFQTHELADSARSDQRVPSLTVARLMAEHHLKWVDLLKVDIEGAEKEVFSSPDVWIGSVGAIAIELHDRFKAGCSRSFYAAVTAFPVEQSRGETVFVARQSVASEGQPAAALAMG
jgi:FkbM family methyltransferase